jgi:hypothetical protein
MAYEFTPAPWRVVRSGDAILIVDVDGAIIAQVGSPRAGGAPTPSANARLMVQAPRLLKHLEKAYKVLTRLSAPALDNAADNAVEGPGADEMMDAMQRAIGDAGGSTE